MDWLNELFGEKDPAEKAKEEWLEEARRREVRDMIFRSGMVGAIEAPPGEYYPDPELLDRWDRGSEEYWSARGAEPAGEWEPTKSPLLLRRRNRDGSWSFSPAIPEDIFGTELAGPSVGERRRW